MSTFTLLATTSPQERAALFSFGFYLLNLLIPLIPAVIIYRVFPEGTTRGSAGASPRTTDAPPAPDTFANSVEGSLGGWKIKAVGAWGAYVTAFLLGYWSIKATAIPLINAIGGASVWKVESHFKLVDERGQEINAAINNLIVEPPLVQPWGKKATITLFPRRWNLLSSFA